MIRMARICLSLSCICAWCASCSACFCLATWSMCVAARTSALCCAVFAALSEAVNSCTRSSLNINCNSPDSSTQEIKKWHAHNFERAVSDLLCCTSADSCRSMPLLQTQCESQFVLNVCLTLACSP